MQLIPRPNERYMDFVSEEEQIGELRFGLMEEVTAAKATIERLQRFIDRSQALLQSLDKKAGDYEDPPQKADNQTQVPHRTGKPYSASIFRQGSADFVALLQDTPSLAPSQQPQNSEVKRKLSLESLLSSIPQAVAQPSALLKRRKLEEAPSAKPSEIPKDAPGYIGSSKLVWAICPPPTSEIKVVPAY